MTADTITLQRIQDLRVMLDVAAEAIFRIEQQYADITPEDAAAIVNETLANIATFDQP